MTGTILAVEVEKISTRADGTISIGLGTPELSPSVVAELFSYRKKKIACYLSPKETIPQKEIDQVDKIDIEFNSKSQSQRIRAVLYKLFEQDNEGFKDFDSFYHAKTELYITHLKSKLNP